MTERGAQRSRRGHQNHPKNIGIRTSNVPTSEIIQALRDGRNLESLFQHHQLAEPTTNVSATRLTENSCDDIQETTRMTVVAEEESSCINLDVKHKENSSSSILTDHNDKKSPTVKSSDSKKRKIKSAQTDIVKSVTRSAGDGAENILDDGEDDDETVELSKLRCTSERTEVIAEREHRRQKKCADYPGLAFGRSIFSSDSMMKFNIIRNELQNIMNNQLRRVRKASLTAVAPTFFFNFRDQIFTICSHFSSSHTLT